MLYPVLLYLWLQQLPRQHDKHWPHRNRIVISKFIKRYLKAKRTRAPAYSRALRRIKGGFPKGVGVRRSSGPISRIPGGDRVAVNPFTANVQVKSISV